MVFIRNLLGTISLTGLLSLPLNAQEIPRNFNPVGHIISPEEDKNNNGVSDGAERTLSYNNSTYRYFRIYNKETKKQTLFIADKEYNLLTNPEEYYNLFSIITINELVRRAKNQNFEKHLDEWANDYNKINKYILTTEFAKKSVEALSELEGLLINKTFFGGARIPELLDYALVSGSDIIAKKRVNNEFNDIILELAEGLAAKNPKDIAEYVLNHLRDITSAKLTESRRKLLITRKKLEDYDLGKDSWSLRQSENFVNDLMNGLEGITYARAYLASLGDDNSLKVGATKVAKNFAEGLTGVSIDKISSDLNRNEQLQKIKNAIEKSRVALTKSLGGFYIALDPKQDPTLRYLLLEEKILIEDKLEKEIASYEKEISAKQSWTLVGPVKEGEKISVTASGKWNRSFLTELDAEGLPSLSSSPPGKYLRESALIGKFGEKGTPFLVGKSYEGTAPMDGNFYLGHNDYDLEDNSGALKVKIRRSLKIITNSGTTIEDK